MIHLLSSLVRDIRYAWRALRKSPSFTVGAVATVAVTVGATTAIFSVVYGVLVRQLPFRDVEQVFWIWSDQVGRDRAPFNVPDFIDYRDSTRTLSGFAGFFADSANLSDNAAAERVQGMRATPDLFQVMGAHARIGRTLEPGDDRPGSQHVVVLAEPFWRRRFGGDRSVVGSTIRLNSEPYTVVGVLAAGFAMPLRDVEFVLPFAVDRDPRRGARNSLNFIIGVGRLGGRASLTQAISDMTATARRLQQQFPVENARKHGVRFVPLIDGIVGPFRTALLTLFAAVVTVLLIACANLANLMLTRAAGRRRDLAVQLALDSSRLQIARQVVVEALMVGSSGGLLGAFIAWWSVDALMLLAPAQLPRAGEVRLDVAVLMFSVVVSLATGLLFGVIPALASARVDVREALQGSGRAATAGGRRLRGGLVSSEVTLAVALLIVMTMLGKSFVNVQAVAPGFDATNVLSARLTLPGKRFNTRETIVAFQRALADQLSSSSSITRTGAITILPLSGLMSRVPFSVEGRAVERERVPLAQFRTVSAGYFEVMGIPLKRGRTFSERDTDRTAPAAVVNEALANRWFQGMEPIGARLLVDDNDQAPRPIDIVGVVGNVQQTTLDGEPTWDLYVPYPQIHRDQVAAAAANMFCVVRTTADPQNLTVTFASTVRKLDPEVAASQIRPMDRYLSEAVATRKFSLTLMVAFAGAAMVLAITGIYAVVMYSVSQRAREIGIRVALGATRPHIVRLVIGDGIVFIMAGLGFGMALAAVVMRLLSTMLFGVTATDATTFAEVVAVVAIASALACALPAVRTALLSVTALRAE